MQILKFNQKNWTLTFFLSVCVLGLFTSCANDIEPNLHADIDQVNVANQNADYDALFASIDSLNAAYTAQNVSKAKELNTAIDNQRFDNPTPERKSALGKAFGVNMADYIGYACGGHVGRWAGGAVGSLTGNPILTVVGMSIGAKVGPSLCGALASSLASVWAYSLMAPVDRENLSIGFKNTSAFASNIDAEMDSIGYYHNACMVKIFEQRDSYITGNTVNYSKIYDDVTNYYKTVGIYDSVFEDPSVKHFLLTEIKEIGQYSIQYRKGDLSETDLTNTYISYLKIKVGFNDQQCNKIKEFGGKIAFRCADLTENQIASYAVDLNQVISESSLSTTKKAELASSADFIINSSLCWQQ